MNGIAPSEAGVCQKIPHRVYLFTSPRTASNLFVKILNLPNQPNTVTNNFLGGYFFMPGIQHRQDWLQWHIPFDLLPKEKQDKIVELTQNSLNKFREFLETAATLGNTAFVKEHAFFLQKPSVERELIYGVASGLAPEPYPFHLVPATDIYTPSNPTVIPDNWLTTFNPTFLIRHPALMFPSFHRTQIEGRDAHHPASEEAMYRNSFNLVTFRRLYDFYMNHYHNDDKQTLPNQPLIIDGEDFIAHPEPLMQYFCEANGFDFNACQFQWDSISNERMVQMGVNKIGRRSLSTIMASTGIIKDKAKADIDIDAEAEKWRAEFGVDQGNMVERLVRAAMPDYLYLYARRLDPMNIDQWGGSKSDDSSTS